MKTAQWDENCDRRRWGHLLSRVYLNSALQRTRSSLNTEKRQRLLQGNWPCYENMACPGQRKCFREKQNFSHEPRWEREIQCVGGGHGGDLPKVKPELSAKFLQCCRLCVVNKGHPEFSSNYVTQPGPFWTLLALCHQNQVLLNGNAERCVKRWWKKRPRLWQQSHKSSRNWWGTEREKLGRAYCLIGWLMQRKGSGLCALVRNPGSFRSSLLAHTGWLPRLAMLSLSWFWVTRDGGSKQKCAHWFVTRIWRISEFACRWSFFPILVFL